MSRSIPPDYILNPPPWLWYVGRIDAPALTEVEGVDYIFAVQHQPDKTNKCVHMHLIIETSLSHKKLRARVRDAYGLQGKMDIFFAPFNWGKLTKCIHYYLDHDHAEVLRQEDIITPKVESVRRDIEGLKQATAQLVARQAEIDAEKALHEKLHLEMWGIPYPYDSAGVAYRYVIDRIEIMTQHWANQEEYMSFKEYATRVLRYITWNASIEKDYRHIYSEYRFRGDVKLLYARYWGVTPDLTVQIFGHL